MGHCQRPVRVRHNSATRSAARPGSSCSQTRNGSQPSSTSAMSLRRSLATFPSSFAFHQARLDLGNTPWSGQQCQKQPSKNTAICALVSAMSGVPGSPLRCFLNLSPRRWSSLRRRTSPVESRRGMRRIWAETAALLGIGASALSRGSGICRSYEGRTPPGMSAGGRSGGSGLEPTLPGSPRARVSSAPGSPHGR